MGLVRPRQSQLCWIGLVCVLISTCLAAARHSQPPRLIPTGKHPKIHFANFDLLLPTDDLRVRHRSPSGTGFHEFDDAPRYFLIMPDEVVETEMTHRLKYHRWSDRVVLEKLYFGLLYGISGFPYDRDRGPTRELQKLEAATGWDFFNRSSDYCTWEGITCKDGTPEEEGPAGGPPVKEIQLDNFHLQGTLTDQLYFLSNLEHLDLKGNMIGGTIPFTWGLLPNLKFLCLSINSLKGRIPSNLGRMRSIERLWLSNNMLSGTIPPTFLDELENLALLDLSNNMLKGPIPQNIGTTNPKLVNLFLESNQLTGRLPRQVEGLQALEIIDVGLNKVSGTIPTSWMSLPNLKDFNVAGNRLYGSVPTELLQLSNLLVVVLSNNRLRGTIPRGDDIIPGYDKGDAPKTGGNWSSLSNLNVIMFNDNFLTGVLPPELLYAMSNSLQTLDVGNNTLTGTIPSEIGKLSNLQRFDAQRNYFTGTLPVEMNRMNPNLELNLTGNLLVGTVPKLFCGGGAMSSNILYRQFECDAILCPAGTFHVFGAATLQAGCRPCPASKKDAEHDPPLHKVLGRVECPGLDFVHGDLNGDGYLSPREILRLLYSDTLGFHWGAQFQTWADTRINECDLNGVVCVNGNVAKIDLTDAALCTNGERKAGPVHECRGIPAELALLTHLEIFTLNRRQFLRGTIPTEFGKLTNLKYLDISSCSMMTGPLPSELGQLTNLKYLNLGGCRFNGTVPEELYTLSKLEKLHLSMNSLSGTVSTKIRQLMRLKELMWSRTQLTGTIPTEIGLLTHMENLEMYGNVLTGVIPASLGNCTDLKRIDLFNNDLNGTIPQRFSQLQSLQILHLKLNQLTGTISPELGDLPFLSWFDISSNRLHGTIPSTFGASRSIKDFRLGDNMIYDPIPQSLCTNVNVNGGLTRTYGCDGVICPLGTFSDPGHATHSEGCKPCPAGTTTMYLGSSQCEEFSEADILSIFFDVVQGSGLHSVHESKWSDPNSNICDWHGITCDQTGEIESIRFPSIGLLADDPDFQ